jgi:DNA-directed RNA polymerase alpha subunit
MKVTIDLFCEKSVALAIELLKDAQDLNKTSPMLNDQVYGWSVDRIGLTVRVLNCLSADDIVTIGDLCQRHEHELLCIPGFGGKCLQGVKEQLAKMNLCLS